MRQAKARANRPKKKRGIRLTIDPLMAYVRIDEVQLLAEAVGVPRHVAYKWIKNGLTLDQADKLAVHYGLHPATVWGQQYWEAEA